MSKSNIDAMEYFSTSLIKTSETLFVHNFMNQFFFQGNRALKANIHSATERFVERKKNQANCWSFII